MLYLIHSPEFIPSTECIRVKIGLSNDPESRLVNLQCGSPCKLEFLHLMDAPDRLENKLHRFFKDSRQIGEWFDLTKSDIEYITQHSSQEIEDWIDSSYLTMSLREAGKEFLRPSQYDHFFEFLDAFPGIEQKETVVIDISNRFLRSVNLEHISLTEFVRRLLSYSRGLEDFLKLTKIDEFSYSIKWEPSLRRKSRLEEAYDEMFATISSGGSVQDIVEQVSPLLTELEKNKLHYLLLGIPNFFERSYHIYTTKEISQKVPGLSTNKVCKDLNVIGEKIQLFSVKPILVDKNTRKEIMDLYGDEEIAARRGGRGKPRYIKIELKEKIT